VTKFPIYNLRHVFCTRLSEVAADAVVERARRHTSPETQASLPVGNGRSGTKGRRENEQTAVRKTRAVTFP